MAAEAIRQGARAWWLRISRDRWKVKVEMVRQEAKRLKVRVYDLEKSRGQWREKAEKLADEVDALRRQCAELQTAMQVQKKAR